MLADDVVTDSPWIKMGSFRDNRFHACCIERGTGADHLPAGQTGAFPREPGEHVNWVGHHDEHAVESRCHHGFENRVNNVDVGAEFTQTGLPGNRTCTGCNDDNVVVSAITPIPYANLRIPAEEFLTVGKIHRLSLRTLGRTVDKHDLIAQAIGHNRGYDGHTDMACSDHHHAASTHIHG